MFTALHESKEYYHFPEEKTFKQYPPTACKGCRHLDYESEDGYLMYYYCAINLFLPTKDNCKRYKE